jgi:hypothetical protein
MRRFLQELSFRPLSSMERGTGGEVARSKRRASSFSVFLLLLLVLAACAETDMPSDSSDPSAQQISDAPPTAVAIVRSIATVDLPPTLSRVDKLATRQAIPQTPTAAPPTATPTETPYVGVFLGPAEQDVSLPRIETEPTAFAEVTPSDPTACAIPIDPVFGTAWQQNPSVARRVGCALQERFGFGADVQVFEDGVMYRRQDSGEVWAIHPDQVRAGRFWYTNLPLMPAPIALTPPEGLRPPSDAFLGLWTSDPLLQQTLGFARTPQQVADLNIQRIEGGTLILDVTITQVFLLLDNGDAFGPY